MTKKQDLISEAEKLGIEITKKDTIAILCEKIKESGNQSNNCPKTNKTNKKPVGRPKKSPINKSPPKKVTKKITKTKVNNVIINFVQGGGEVQLNIENNGDLIGSDITDILNDIRNTIDGEYIVKEDGESVDLEKYTDVKGSVFSIEKVPIRRPGKSPATIKLNGVNKYIEMGNLKLLGVSEREERNRNMSGSGFRFTKFAFYSPKEEKYYILAIELLYSGVGPDKQKIPTRLVTTFEEANKKTIDKDILSNSRPMLKTIKNNMNKTIVFEGSGKKANIIFNMDEIGRAHV